SNNGPRGAIVPPTTVIPEMLLWQRRGRSKSASGPPFLPGELPETPPVVPFERPVGARDDDGVAAERVAVEPGGLVGAGVDAAVADVPAALGPHVVLGVHVLAAVGDADGVVDHHVVVAGVALGPAWGDHADRVALVHGQVDAAGGGVFAGGGHARADRHVLHGPAVAADRHAVGAGVDLAGLVAADGEGERPVGGAVEAGSCPHRSEEHTSEL